MSVIKLLDKDTINKIAAGEVIERPASVVKELLENAIDSGATQITLEIKDGGISLIRVTDNGCGIAKDDIKCAFLRHATSKIRSSEDLSSVLSLGFRGEALASIAAVSRTELITKTTDTITGVRYAIEGGEEIAFEDIGAPNGTTIIIRDLFYNTPARKKFLKSASTEGSHVAELIEKLSFSHPEISIRFINNNQTKFQTSGNNSLRDIIYNIYGKEIANSLLPINEEGSLLKLSGYIGKPEISRGNRNLEICFINGRYIKSNIIYKAIENGYGNHMMQHQFPLAILSYDINTELVDVNVHPTKQEVRFSDSNYIYDSTLKAIEKTLANSLLVKNISLDNSVKAKIVVSSELSRERSPEPFEVSRNIIKNESDTEKDFKKTEDINSKPRSDIKYDTENKPDNITIKEQLSLADEYIKPDKSQNFTIIGQVFNTYWIVQYNNSMYIIDQHAAHEKVLYERYIKLIKNSTVNAQYINPPIVLSLTDSELNLTLNFKNEFKALGFEIDEFGDREIVVRSIPLILPSINKEELLKEMIGELSEDTGLSSDISLLQDRVATMACKAAVKGGSRLSYKEIVNLIDEMLSLDNPFNCPHGRPTIIEITKAELERKFKRIL